MCTDKLMKVLMGHIVGSVFQDKLRKSKWEMLQIQ